jgi:nucleoid DNA-binding protein
MKTITRTDLRKALQQKGFTYRESRIIVTIIIDSIKDKLKKGEQIDLPIGRMTPVSPEPKRAYQLGKMVKTYTKKKIHFRRKD